MGFLTDHLDEVGESYFRHMGRAAWFAVVMLVGGVACLVHAVLPFLFVRTASDRVRRLHAVMVKRFASITPVPGAATEAADDEVKPAA